MNNDKEIIKLFINNEPMQRAVKSVVASVFMAKKPDEDIHTKAGRFIALELLNEAWLELERLKTQKDEEPVVRGQIGL